MLKDRTPVGQITLGLWIAFISFILVVIDGFIALGKGEANASFSESVTGRIVDALYIIFGVLILIGLLLVVVGVVRLIAGRVRSR